MESWRQRGYVPDSDSEEEFDSQGSVFTTAQVDDHGTQGNGGNGPAGNDKDDGKPEHTVLSETAAGHVMDVGEGSRVDPLDVEDKEKEEEEESQVVPVLEAQQDIASSPDELQGDPIPRRKPFPSLPQTQEATEDDSSTSPLSSLSSTVGSPPPDEQNQNEQMQDEQEHPATRPNDDLEELLPSFDIPQHILDELDQPTRRSLRQRNPIQLHPYLLENAQYQMLMKARGIKPVRLPRHEHERAQAQARAQASDESQDQEFLDTAEPPSSSPVPEFQHPPSSPEDPEPVIRRRYQSGTQQAGDSRDDLPTASEPPAFKRRKLTHYGHKKARQNRPDQSSNLRVLIDNTETPNDLEGTSIFDIPPSPPRSGSISSTQTTSHSGFRFPRGFTPPTITPPVTDPKSKTRHADVVPVADTPGPSASHDFIDVESRSSHSEPSSEPEIEPDPEDLAVRRLQRKIKGVLPASWLRLDLKQQEEKRVTLTQRNRDAGGSHRPENAKGVARKVVREKNSASSTNQSRQRIPLLHLSDDEEEDDDKDLDANNSRDDDTRQALANLLGVDDPFEEDVGDDIPEDNRIDYMFPSIPRSSASSRTRKPGAKRQRSPKDRTNSGGKRKRARLQWQTRITDAKYGAQKAKRSLTPRPSKIGILDAPDVAERPRGEQPRFLRIAARRARTRKDQGRRSPTRKFIRLDKPQDTEDANVSLREWRKGAIKRIHNPRPRSRSHQRQPLRDTSASRQNVFGYRDNGGITRHVVTDSHDVIPLEERSVASASVAHRQDVPSPSVTSEPNAKNAPRKAERRGNEWVVRRNLAISSLKRNAPRPAEPDLGDISRSHFASPSLFQRSLSMLDRNHRHARASRPYKSSLTLDRFLSENTFPAPPGERLRATSVGALADQAASSPNIGPQATKRRHLRKRPPKRLNVDAVEHQQPPPLPYEDSGALPIPSDEVVPRPPGQASQGLISFQRSYTTDFNVTPLLSGTFFHESTFVGSGEFARSLEVYGRDLDKDHSFLSIDIGTQTHRWGPWNDAVSTGLGAAFDTMIEGIEKTGADSDAGHEALIDRGCSLYRSAIQYVTDNLTFIDPIDRTGFVERALALISKLSDALAGSLSSEDRTRNYHVRLACYNLVFANQVYQVSRHHLVNSTVAKEASETVNTVAKQLFALIFNRPNQTAIRKFLEDNKLQERRQTGIRDDHPAVEAHVVARHILHGIDASQGIFESLTAEGVLSFTTQNAKGLKNVGHLEDAWHTLFTTLPLMEIDRFGIARIGSRFREVHGNWKAVEQLLHPVLDEYHVNSPALPVSYNNYCRALFHRCFYLINSWGWRDCESILKTLFYFFAKHTLYNLKQEESFGSPSFLDDLDRDPPLEIKPGESCFHILLKIVGSGLRFVSRIYDKKKILNLAWRLLPNHGRVYPKEKPLRSEDLDALRNHHDLLCTVFWAVPDEYRPRLQAIRNLVDPARSHVETLNISFQAWIRLVRFKLSTNEAISGLDPFADWHGTFVNELLKQHALARTEVEAQCTADNRFSRQRIDKVISENQRQIESLLNTTLGGLRNAVKQAPTLEHARVLVSKMPIKPLLGLFNPKANRVNSVVSEVLQVVVTYVQKDAPALLATATTASAAPASADEDSQEYGDWADIEAMYETVPPQHNQGIEHVDKVFHPAVSRLVSNCFGEDHSPEDAILLTVVDCWTWVAQTLVRHGLRHWDSYLSPYGGDSWASLRSTVQTRKFTPQFLASCIDRDTRFYSECKPQILGMWASSLVERASMLKFQHRLTEALLNQDAENPLLKNLPFSKNRANRYVISLEEFIQRRLSLISCLLSNMREHLQDLEEARASEFSNTQVAYRELLQRLTGSMKANYQELGNGGDSAQGAYVDFVHRIIGFLQQHTRDIGPIDPFFTDPTSFPLPSTDPTYIVARLKSYEPKLATEKVAKTLIIFIQGVSERAAIDNQQGYLVNQLCASMADTYEAGDPTRPTLRAMLLQCLFPAYLEATFSNRAAWILSRPILQTISLVFKELLFNIDTTDTNCVSSVMGIFRSVFESSFRALHAIADNPDSLRGPTILITVAAFVEMMTSALPVIDYIDRVTDVAGHTIVQIQAFQQFASWCVSRLADPGAEDSSRAFLDSFQTFPPMDTLPTTVPAFFQEARALASRELLSYINESWSRHRDKYYFTRRGAHQPQEVGIDPSLAAQLDHMSEQTLKHTVVVFMHHVKALNLDDD